jgi:hypothetical protein
MISGKRILDRELDEIALHISKVIMPASRLRRALPITRQRVEWEKIAAYKAGGGQLSK